MDMCAVEENLEEKRRTLALRTDFNLQDAYKMFTQLNTLKQGVDVDDLDATLKGNLKI
jgi:hypothetical protein